MYSKNITLFSFYLKNIVYVLNSRMVPYVDGQSRVPYVIVQVSLKVSVRPYD